MSPPVVINSSQQFAQLLQSSRTVVTDFYADWCGPCKEIAPLFEQSSRRLSRKDAITFAKVNTDHQKEIAGMYSVSSLPTCVVFKNSREVKRITGANMKALFDTFKELAAEASTFDTTGSTSADTSSSGDNWCGAAIARGYSDVSSSVDTRGLDFSNIDSAAGLPRTIFATKKPSGLNNGKAKAAADENKDWIESDTDEQLMMFIPFQSTMKIQSLQLTSLPGTSPSSSASEDGDVMRPRTISIYTNRTTVLDFSEAESTEPTQSFTLSENDWDAKTGTATLDLKFVRFQKVTSLVVFVSDAAGDGEKTRIDRLKVIGESGEARSMGKLEKIGDEQGE